MIVLRMFMLPLFLEGSIHWIMIMHAIWTMNESVNPWSECLLKIKFNDGSLENKNKLYGLLKKTTKTIHIVGQ
jgi:hypothetical protein